LIVGFSGGGDGKSDDDVRGDDGVFCDDLQCKQPCSAWVAER